MDNNNSNSNKPASDAWQKAIILSVAIVAILFNGLTKGLWVDAILGLVLGVVILEVVARLGYLVAKTRALGEADTYVAGAIGACFGVVGLLNVLLYCFFILLVLNSFCMKDCFLWFSRRELKSLNSFSIDTLSKVVRFCLISLRNG